MASGFVNFENGACLYVKAGQILNVVNEGQTVELCGVRGGICCTGSKVKMVTVDDSGYFLESEPVLREKFNEFDGEINHFIDCCNGKTECICTPHQGTEIMKIITGIYESAKTGKEIVF